MACVIPPLVIIICDEVPIAFNVVREIITNSGIQNGNPNPAGWGTPAANFAGCNFDAYFKNLQIVSFHPSEIYESNPA